MQEHFLVALPVGRSFQVAGTLALDLYAAAGFLLNVFNIGSAMANDLCTKVEARNRFKADGDLLFGPFPLWFVSNLYKRRDLGKVYSAKLVKLHLLPVPTTEPPLVDQRWELLLHELLNLGNSLLKTGLGRARDVQIQRRVLRERSAYGMHAVSKQTYCRSCQALVGVVASAGGDIF